MDEFLKNDYVRDDSNADASLGIDRLLRHAMIGLMDGGIQKPTNAFLDILTYAKVPQYIDAPLPRLQVVEAPADAGIAYQTGAMTGKALNILCLSKLLVDRPLTAMGVPQAGLGATALRLGSTGFVYGTLFEQAEGNASLPLNRLRNGLIEGGTWAAMGTSSELLNRSVVFRPTPFRTLAGDMAIGGLSGAAGGLTHSTLHSLLHQQDFQPDKIRKDVGDYALSGMAMGAATHWLNGSDHIVRKYRTAEVDQEIITSRGANGVFNGAHVNDQAYGYTSLGYNASNYIYAKNADGSWFRRSSGPVPSKHPMLTVGQNARGHVVSVGHPHQVSPGVFSHEVNVYSTGLNETAVFHANSPKLQNATEVKMILGRDYENPKLTEWLLHNAREVLPRK